MHTTLAHIIRIICSFLLVALVPAVHGQVNWLLRTSSNVLAKEETLLATYSLHHAVSDSFIAPDFADWQVVKGPWSKTTIVEDNGVKTTIKEFHFQLRARHTGSCTVPAAKIEVNGRYLESNAMLVEVVAEANQAALARHENFPAQANEFTYDAFIIDPSENITDKIGRNAFLRIKTSKQKVYEGEPLVAEYLLYSRVSLQAQVIKRPGFNGFSSIDLMDEPIGDFVLESIGGKVFKVFLLRKVQLYPTESGRHSLAPVSVEAQVSFRRVPQSGDIKNFDLYAADNVVEQTVMLESDAPVIEVMPFPASNKPAAFQGLAGQFKLSAALQPSVIKRGETARLVVRTEGTGNWSIMQAPPIQWPKGFSVYEPVVEENIDSQSVPVKGYRQWTYPFTVDTAGSFQLPAVSFNFFDPQAARYEQLQVKPPVLQVEAALYASQSPDYLEQEAPTPLIDWFTRYTPIVFIGAALLLIGFILLQRGWRRRMIGKQSPADDAEEDNELTWPPEMVWPPVSSNATVTLPETNKMNSELPGQMTDAQVEAAHYKQQVDNWRRSLLTQQGQPLNDTQLQLIRQFENACNEVLYSPFNTKENSEQLRRLFATVQGWLQQATADDQGKNL